MTFVKWMRFSLFSYVSNILSATSFKCLAVLNINPLKANPTKWSKSLKQFVGNLPTSCLIVFDYFVKLALKALKRSVAKKF